MFCVTYQITVFLGRGAYQSKGLSKIFGLFKGWGRGWGGLLIESGVLVTGIAALRPFLSLTEISVQK